MNRSKQIGTRWESAIVDYLRANGAPHAERRATNGAKDRGDITGLPGVVIEAKDEKTITLSRWLAEAEAERRNDNMAPVAVVWHKRRGKASPGDAYVTMTGHQFLGLLADAGYLPDPPPSDGDPPEWAVDHPGIGIIPYDTEDAAHTAAGTAGTILHRGQPI